MTRTTLQASECALSRRIAFATFALCVSLGVACGDLDRARTPQTKPAVIDPLGPQALRSHVEFLTGLEPARSYGNAAALERAAQYIEDSLRDAGGKPTRQRFEVDGATYSNVSCLLGPPQGARWIIGAHYDSFGDLPGADDNASGVAVLLALAHALKTVELAQPVELVAYSLEEPPQYDTRDMGSARHAQMLVDEKIEVAGMICLEMLGYYSDEPGSQSYPIEQMKLMFGDKADFLVVVGRPEDASLIDRVHLAMQGTALRVEKIPAPRDVTGVDFSDHRNYWAVGFTSVMITDTSFYRNANYHQSTDTADTLDYGRMANAVIGVTNAVRQLAARE